MLLFINAKNMSIRKFQLFDLQKLFKVKESHKNLKYHKVSDFEQAPRYIK